jgi:hypothetical protein
MVDLDAMDKDPWTTWPVDKLELRILVEENEKLRAANVYLCSRVDYLPYCREIERLLAALNADAQTLRLHLGEMTAQEMRTVRAAFDWVLGGQTNDAAT